MKRRLFLQGATAAGLTGSWAAAGPAIAQGKRMLKMVTTWPKNFPGIGTGAERVARRITAATEGALTVRVFAAGELVPPFEAFDAVASGAAEMYHGAEYYWQGKSKAFNFFAAVPFGLTGPEMSAWIHFGGGQALWNELSAQFNIKPFMAGNTGVQMGGWFKDPVESLEDFRGLRIRMPGLGGEVMRRLGAAVVTLSGGEIFPALQQGSIDATEWIGPWNDLAFGFYKIVQNYYFPGFHEPGTTLTVGFNKDVWESLTASQQEIVSAILMAENDYMLAEYNARNAVALQVLKQDHNVKVRRFSNAILKEVGRISGEVVREVADGDDLSRRVFESFRTARKNAIAWGNIADQAYGDARRLPFKYA